MNPLDYERTVDALLKEKIVFLGVGDSGIVASSATRNLSAGASAILQMWITQMALAALLCERDVCVPISHSGDTASIVRRHGMPSCGCYPSCDEFPTLTWREYVTSFYLLLLL